MTRVIAIILHAVPGAGAVPGADAGVIEAPGARTETGPLESAFAAVRTGNAARLAAGFTAAGAEAQTVETTAGGPSFGARLRRAAASDPAAGLVALGSGSIPLATRADLRAFVAAAGRPGGPCLANNRYSADVIAVPPGVDLLGLPDLAADNGLPRWLAAHGQDVRDLRTRWRLGVDLDSPLTPC